ncbi:hypothetical protein CDD81_7919 [Ophiocordyceps australis]|uniref:2'-phosphotransferase n=1 Tax=Ophiocordyceps australis TaxID=1399860 RepID=A0A2C5Y2C4_9HYPO|nr:hypothetical protein CDD81_7919 [Ophiocordyceps australis]
MKADGSKIGNGRQSLGKTRDEASGKQGGRGGRGGREVQTSKALSKLLRHQAENAGIQLDAEGYAPLDKVLSWPPLKSLKVTVEEVQSIVTTNDKQRFSLKPKPGASSSHGCDAAELLIRANQGHSLKLDSASLLEPVTLAAGNVPPCVLHGTYFAFWPAIEAAGGLKPMGRNHIHCATGMPGSEGGVVSGMRNDAQLIVEIDAEASLQAGVEWWRSDNGVLLTQGNEQGILSTAFFKRVTGRRLDVGVLWEEGVKEADLPQGINATVPRGKGRPHGRGERSRSGQQEE